MVTAQRVPYNRVVVKMFNILVGSCLKQQTHFLPYRICMINILDRSHEERTIIIIIVQEVG